MKRIVCFIIILFTCTSCFYIPVKLYNEYEIIGDIVNEDTTYIKGNKHINSKTYVVIKENGDTCILKESIIKNNKTNKFKIKYKKEKFLLQK